MHQRGPGNGRPSGTDGSDFSYRMVVDSRTCLFFILLVSLDFHLTQFLQFVFVLEDI